MKQFPSNAKFGFYLYRIISSIVSIPNTAIMVCGILVGICILLPFGVLFWLISLFIKKKPNNKNAEWVGQVIRGAFVKPVIKKQA